MSAISPSQSNFVGPSEFARSASVGLSVLPDKCVGGQIAHGSCAFASDQWLCTTHQPPFFIWYTWLAFQKVVTVPL